ARASSDPESGGVEGGASSRGTLTMASGAASAPASREADALVPGASRRALAQLEGRERSQVRMDRARPAWRTSRMDSWVTPRSVSQTTSWLPQAVYQSWSGFV